MGITANMLKSWAFLVLPLQDTPWIRHPRQPQFYHLWLQEINDNDAELYNMIEYSLEVNTSHYIEKRMNEKQCHRSKE